MTDKSTKDSKKCGKNKKLMFAYGIIQIGSSSLSAIALTLIALGICSLKNESKFFNLCVEEVRGSSSNISSAVRFCNGGN